MMPKLLMISTDYSLMPIQKSKTIRKISKYTISNESWDTIFDSDDVHGIA